MKNPLLAARYAKSLFDLAAEMKHTDTILADAQYIKAVINSSDELVQLLRSPIVKADKKTAILKAVFGENIHVITDKFVQLLVQKGRELFLEQIVDAYIQQYRKANKIKSVTVTTAVSVGDDLQNLLAGRLREVMPGYQFEMKGAVDPDLIGGFTMEMDDKIVDASIKRDLNEVKKQFIKNVYESAIR